MSYYRMFFWVLTLVLMAFLIFPYFKSFTVNVTADVEFDSFCTKPDFDRSVLVEYNRSRDSSVVYCLYDNSRDNTRLEMVRNNSDLWQVEATREIGKRRLYWPLIF